MDVEKAIEFILEQQARFDARFDSQMSHLTEKMNQQTEKMNLLVDQQIGMEERHDREIADIRAVTASTSAELRRAVRMSVEELRRERVRRQELAAAQVATRHELAAAQLATEQKLQKLIDLLSKKNGTQ